MISVSCTHSLSINISNVTCDLGWRRPQDVVYISQRHHTRCPYNLLYKLLSGREPWWSFKVHRTTVTYITLFFIIFTLLVECPLLLRGSRPRSVCFLNFLSYPPGKSLLGQDVSSTPIADKQTIRGAKAGSHQYMMPQGPHWAEHFCWIRFLILHTWGVISC